MGTKKALISIFMGLIIALPMATFFMPNKQKSELENKYLTQPPTPTIDEIKDKTYMKQTEKFILDQFIFRYEFVEARTKLELAQGNRFINGVFVDDNMLFEKLKKPNEIIMSNNAKAINNFAKKYKNKFNTNIMLIPTASEFYPEKMPLFSEKTDQTTIIKDFYSHLKGVNTIDAFAPLSAACDEKIFYNTDKNWTSYGAYIGYTALARTLGYKPVTYDMFNVEHVATDFLGSNFSKILYGKKMADKIDLYNYAQENVFVDVIKYKGKTKQTYPTIFFKDKLQQTDKYNVFMNGDDSIAQIKTNVKNSKKLIIFKDSFSLSLMQFLPLHYEEILLVDLHLLNQPLSSVVDINEYTQALFLYNMSSFINDESLKKVDNL